MSKKKQGRMPSEHFMIQKTENNIFNGIEKINLNDINDKNNITAQEDTKKNAYLQNNSLELINVDEDLNELILLFNNNPIKAIPLLCQYYHYDKIAPPVIAHIIHTTPGLKNEKILSLFTSRNKSLKNSKNNENERIANSLNFIINSKINLSKFNIDIIPPSTILKAYFDEMNLKVSLLDAMRTCLDATKFLNCSFEKMDYILKIFSFSYFEQNKSAMKVSYIYLAVLSIILLNNEILKTRSNKDNYENIKKMTPEYYDIIIKHVFPEQYLRLFSTGAVYRRINSKPFSQKIFNPENIKIHFECKVDKKTNKWSSIFQKRFLSLNNNRLVLYKEKNKKNPTNFLLINSNLTIQAEKNHPKQAFIRSLSFIYKNKKKLDLIDYECYTSLTASTKKQFENGIVEDFSHVSDTNILTSTESSKMATPFSSSSYDFLSESKKGNSLLYAHSSRNDRNSSIYKKNVDELILRFESIDECKACSFALKKVLLISFFIQDLPLLTIPPAFLDY